MQDSFNTGLGSYDVDSKWSANADPTTQTQRTRSGIIKDTSSVSSKTDNFTTNSEIYTPTSGRPQIEKPSLDADPGGLKTIMSLLQTKPEQVLSNLDALPVPVDKFSKKLDKEISTLSDEQHAQAGQGKSKEQTEAMVRYSVFHPDAPLPPSIRQLAQTLSNNAQNSSGTQISQATTAMGDLMVNEGYESVFKATVMNSGLSPEDQQSVLAAHSMPEFADKLPPNLQAVLKGAEATALNVTQSQFGVPDSWKPSSTSDSYQKSVSLDLQNKVDDALYQKRSNGEINTPQYNALRTLHYIPGANPPNAEALKTQLNQIQNSIAPSLQKSWGFPSSYQPKADGGLYQAIVTGAYYAAFKNNMDSAVPALSAAAKTSLNNALISPAGLAQLTPELKATLSKLQAAAVSSVSKTYALPTTWAPDPVQVAKAALGPPPNIVLAQNMINETKAYITNAYALLADLGISATSTPTKINNNNFSVTPPAASPIANINNNNFSVKPPAAKPPAGVTGAAAPPPPSPSGLGGPIENYLRAVSLALGDLQEALYASSSETTQLANMTNRTQEDANVGQIAQQKKQLDETMAKQAKMASMGVMKAIFMWLIIIIMLMMSVFCPVLAIMAVAMIVNSLAQHHGNPLQVDFFADAGKTATEIGGPKLGKAVTILLILAVAVLCPMALVMDLCFGQGDLPSEFLTALGLPPNVVTALTMVIQVVAQIVAAIVMAILTCGASIELSVMELGETCLQFGAKMAETITEVAINLGENFFKEVARLAVVALTKVQELAQSLVDDFVDEIKNLFGSMKDLDKMGDELGSLLKLQDKTENYLKRAQEALKTAKEDLSTATADLSADPTDSDLTAALAKAQKASDEAEADLKNIVEDLKEITTKIEKAQKELDEASEGVKTEMEILSTRFNEAEALSSFGQNMVQGGISINNNALSAEIAVIKADLDAYLALIAQFIANISVLQNQLLSTLKDLGTLIKNVGQEMQDFTGGLSSAMTNLAHAG